MKNIAIFASGSGTNAENIIRHFSTRNCAKVVAVFVNNPQAGVIRRASNLGTEVVLFDRTDLYGNGVVLSKLKSMGIDFVILAGFLWHVPGDITAHFTRRLINIHPALLPEFGGKGMYGYHVHQAVIDAGKRVSGITIHFVNENYDEGDIIFRAECEVLDDDTPETLATRIHELEYKHYPAVIEQLVTEEANM